jgi:hypothetical protein
MVRDDEDENYDDQGGENGDWTWNAGPAIPFNKGRVLSLLVTDDRENYVSYIYEHPAITRQGKLLFEDDIWLTDLWRSPTGRIYASAEGGVIQVFENGRWLAVQTRESSMLGSVWGLNDDHVWATGEGVILQQQGRQWAYATRDHDVYIDRIHGLTADDLYAVGRRGLMLHWDGREWRRIELPTNMDINAVHVVAADQVYAAGAEGVVLSGAGDEWQVIRIEEDLDFLDVVAFRETIYLGGAHRGLFSLQSGEIVPVRDDIRASRLRADGNALCVAGNLSIHRFDGKDWQSYTYS